MRRAIRLAQLAQQAGKTITTHSDYLLKLLQSFYEDIVLSDGGTITFAVIG